MAELELKNFISMYPDSPNLDEAKEKLRAVQEVLAEGIFKIANFYATIGSIPGAVDRYVDVLETYPDFSRTPEALYSLGEVMCRNDNAGEAIIYYNRVIRDYPLSEEVERATERLVELDQPIPETNPAALRRTGDAPKPNEKGLFARMFGLMGRRPDVSTETTAASIIPSEEPSGDGQEGVFEVEGAVVDVDAPSE